MKKRLAFGAAFALWCTVGVPGLTLMSYNVENLFDDVHDGTEYREFDPSRGKWTAELFNARITAISEVVRKAVRGGPDLLLLQEVENANALDRLVGRGLAGMGYAWSVLVPKRGCAVNLAVVSRLPIARVRSHGVPPWQGAEVRDVIEVEVSASSHTLHVFDLHWKSKVEGARATEASRRQSALVLGRRVAEILAADSEADIVAAGDFNECADEYARIGRRYPTALMPAGASPPSGQPPGISLTAIPGGWPEADRWCTLFDPWLEKAHSPAGSYSFQGEWLTIDHILLSRGLFDARGFHYRGGSFGPVALPFLLTKNVAYSDHLPVMATIDVER